MSSKEEHISSGATRWVSHTLLHTGPTQKGWFQNEVFKEILQLKEQPVEDTSSIFYVENTTFFIIHVENTAFKWIGKLYKHYKKCFLYKSTWLKF